LNQAALPALKRALSNKNNVIREQVAAILKLIQKK
jgi:hypothetical protein